MPQVTIKRAPPRAGRVARSAGWGRTSTYVTYPRAHPSPQGGGETGKSLRDSLFGQDQTMSASLVSSDSTRHQCGSKSAPMGHTLAL